jgi:transcriptional regulator with XRE-family HTH domain
MRERPHGYARYRLDQCRCYVCGLARSLYDERRTKMLTAGTWRPFVPIEATREHVLLLGELGFGHRQIARLAGVDRKLVRDIASGYRHDPGRGNPPLRKIRAQSAAAILAVPADQLQAAARASIDSTLTWARIDALLEAGWTRGQIAQEALGAKYPALQLKRGQRVSVANARNVKAYFDRVLGDSWLNDETYVVDDEDDDEAG